MKKSKLLFTLLSLFVTGCAPFATNNSLNNEQTNGQNITHNYEISETSISIAINESKKLYISDNGTITNNDVWSSNNTKVASVTSDGTVNGIKTGTANITGTIDSNNKLVCVVSITSSGGSSTNNDTAIVKFFKNNSNYAYDDGKSYAFVSIKSKYDYTLNQTVTWNLYFIYDTSDDSCLIKSQLNGTISSSGKKFYYYDYNVFYWGDYKNGLFTGGYCQEINAGSDTYAKQEIEYSNSSLVFRIDHTLTMGYDLTYTVKTNQFSSNPTSDEVLFMFSRVTECCSFAHEIFSTYNSNLTLY